VSELNDPEPFMISCDADVGSRKTGNLDESVGRLDGGSERDGGGVAAGFGDEGVDVLAAEGFLVVRGAEVGWTDSDGCGDDEGFGDG
jgi:hypothetical protein